MRPASVISLVILISALLSLLPPAGVQRAEALLTDVPVNWNNFNFVPATYNGGIIYDYEGSSDPSRGTAAINPADTDISSCSPNGYLPGNQPSFLWSYYDGGTPAAIADDRLALRMRLNGTPLEQSQVGLNSGHWYILIDIDNDGFKEFAIDIDGTVGSNRPDRVYLLYNNLPTNTVTARSGAQRSQNDTLGGDEINIWYASGSAATGAALTNNHVRVLTATPSCFGGNEYWLDVQVPIAAFNVGGVQLLEPGTPARFFISTSASATDPLQKDWMLKILTDPIYSDTWHPGVYASKTAELLTDADGNGTASPGDVLRYKISIFNTGQIPMLNVVFSDNISDSNLQLSDNVITTTGTVVKGNTFGDSEVIVNIGTIAAGTSENVSFHVTIRDTFPPGVSVVSNQGLVSGSNFTSIHTDDPATTTPEDATRTTVTIPPRLQITKEGPDTASTGSYITFTGTLTNYGTEPAENVTLVDQLPAGLIFVDSSHSAIYNPGANTVTWNLGTLGGGTSVTGWLTVLVDNTTPNGTVLTNTFSVNWKDGSGKSYGPSTATKNVTARNIPFLEISKSGPATGSPGSLLTYTGTLTNPSNSTAMNVVLVDYLPAGLTYVSSSHGAVYDPGSNTITWQIGNLPAGVSIPGWVTVQVNSGIPNGTVLTDTFSVTWQDNSGNPYGPATSSVNTTIYTDPEITITKEGPANAAVGSYITFTGTLTNVGGSAAENVTLVDYLPAGLIYIGSSHTAVYDQVTHSITWHLGTVGPGTAIPGWVELRVVNQLPNGTNLHNLFSVTWRDSLGGAHGPAEASADVIVRTLPFLEVTKSGPAEASAGGILTFNIVVTNSGGSDAQNVMLTDILPDKYTVFSSSHEYSLSGGNVIWNLGTVAAGGSVQVVLRAAVAGNAGNDISLVNSAVAYWQYQGANYGPAGSSVTTTIYAVPHLNVSKTGNSTAGPGDICTYTITVSNISNTAASSAVLVDYIPPTMTYAASSPIGTASGDNVTWNLGTIAPWGTKTVTVSLRVDPSISQASTLTDIALVTWKDSLNNNYGPASAQAQTTVNPFPVLTLGISGPVNGNPCDTLTYRLQVTNTSFHLQAQNAGLQYILPSRASYVRSSDGGSHSDGIVTWNLGTLAAQESREVTVTISYCVIPVGSEFISTAGLSWQYPGGNPHGPVFDTTTTRIIAQAAPPPAPPRTEPLTFVPPTSPLVNQLPASHSSATTTATRPWIDKPLDLPDIVVQTATLSATQVEPGMPIDVNVSVRNRGTAKGSTRINIYVNGQVESSQGLVLNSSEGKDLTFTLHQNEPGTYSVYVNSKYAGDYTVTDPVGSNLLLIFSWACILGALILGILLVRRRLYSDY